MYENGLGMVIDHTHHFTGNGEQLAEIVQPLGALKTRQKAREKRMYFTHIETEMKGERERERTYLT